MPRRHKRTLTFRPPLPRRAIVWFPIFEDPLHHARIAQFRAAHDPLATHVAPHVALVYPFHANLSVAQLESHIKHVSAGWPVLPVTFRGIAHAASGAGLFTLLQCDMRREALTALHDRLYRGPLAGFLRPDLAYEPHITIGRDGTPAALEATIADAELRLRESVRATLRELTVVRYNDDGTIKTEAVVPLDRA